MKKVKVYKNIVNNVSYYVDIIIFIIKNMSLITYKYRINMFKNGINKNNLKVKINYMYKLMKIYVKFQQKFEKRSMADIKLKEN